MKSKNIIRKVTHVDIYQKLAFFMSLFGRFLCY